MVVFYTRLPDIRRIMTQIYTKKEKQTKQKEEDYFEKQKLRQRLPYNNAPEGTLCL